MTTKLEDKVVTGSNLESILIHAHNAAVDKFHDVSPMFTKVTSIKTATAGVGGVTMVVNIEVFTEQGQN